MPVNALPTLAFLVQKFSIEFGSNEVRAGESIPDRSARVRSYAVHNGPEFLVREKSKGVSNVDDSAAILRLHVLPFLSVWVESLKSTFSTEQDRQAADVGVGTQT